MVAHYSHHRAAISRTAAKKTNALNHLVLETRLLYGCLGRLSLLNRMTRVAYSGVTSAFLFVAVSMAVSAQFKEAPPAPYSLAVARQKIRLLIETGDRDSRQQTAEKLSGLLVWYRDIVDDELIAAWKGDQRVKLPALMPLLADSRVASAIIEFSWRQQRAATFNLAYAPMLGDLMARYPNSADPFVRDLDGPMAGGGQMPDLSPSEADTVCRILLDMPDTGDWKKIALQVLPHYRLAAQNLLVEDLRGNDTGKSYRAQRWITELSLHVTSEDNEPRRKLMPRTSAVAGSGNQIPAGTFLGRPHIVEQPSASIPPSDAPYSGPSSGTLKCNSDPVPPNAEYTFPGMPLGNLQIDLDGKPWDARLVPGKGQTQDLILVNRSSTPQKRCTVRWKIIP
jgi:hypothetical protein